MCMAHLLQYLRDGVQLVDLSAGHFADVLLGNNAFVGYTTWSAGKQQ